MSFAVAPDWGQPPRYLHEPAGVVRSYLAPTAGLCADAGMPLDAWQQLGLGLMLGVRVDDSWAAFEVGIDVSRQNGKGGILEGRELGGLFLFGETRIIHSAHEADTATEAFERMRSLINGRTWLWTRVAKINAQPGKQFILLKDGRRLSYRTRTAGGGRGFSAPTLILDEAQELQRREIAAIVPVMSAQPNAQMIYAFTVKAEAPVARGVVERGRAGVTARLGYAEWSAPDGSDSEDREAWRAANPALGIRISEEYIADELAMFRAADAEAEWRMERLGIWPLTSAIGIVIPVAAWEGKCRTDWRPARDVTGGVVAVAVSMDRKYACVGYAVPGDGRPFGELVAQTDENRPGIDWVLPYLTGLQARRRPVSVVVDKAGPAFPLVNAMIVAGLPVQVTEFPQWKTACALFVDRVVTGQVAHSGQPVLTESAQGVQWRVSGDAKVYDRKTPGVLVAPIEAVTLAVWGLVGSGSRPSKYETDDLLVL